MSTLWTCNHQMIAKLINYTFKRQIQARKNLLQKNNNHSNNKSAIIITSKRILSLIRECNNHNNHHSNNHNSNRASIKMHLFNSLYKIITTMKIRGSILNLTKMFLFHNNESALIIYLWKCHSNKYCNLKKYKMTILQMMAATASRTSIIIIAIIKKINYWWEAQRS